MSPTWIQRSGVLYCFFISLEEVWQAWFEGRGGGIRSGRRSKRLNVSWIAVVAVALTTLVPAVYGDNLGTLRTYQRAGCEGELVTLRCPQGTSISVQVAQYGRPSPSSASSSVSQHHSAVSSSTLYRPPPLCPGHSPAVHRANATCHWPSALQYSLLQTVVEACQKKRQCKFQVTAKELSGGAAVDDICPGSSKFVEVAYKCRPFEFRSKVACEDESTELRCGSHARIAVYSASFGRTEYESIQCPQPQGVPEETCLVSYATETAMQMCHGKRKCVLNANAATFGNPCKQESRMYLKVVYTCVPRKVLKERYDEKGPEGAWEDGEEGEEGAGEGNDEYDSYGGGTDDLFRESSAFSPPPNADDDDSEFGGGPGKAQPSLVGKSAPGGGGPTPRPHSKGGQASPDTGKHSNPNIRRRGSLTKPPAVIRTPRPRLHPRLSSSPSPTPTRPAQEDDEEGSLQGDGGRFSDYPTPSSPDPSVAIVNCTVTVLTERNSVIGFVTEWIHAYHFLSRNREKLYLYICVSVGAGLVVLLSAVAGRLYLGRRRESRRMRRRRGGPCSSSSGHSPASSSGGGGVGGGGDACSSGDSRGLPNGFLAAEDVDMMSEIDADIDLMVATSGRQQHMGSVDGGGRGGVLASTSVSVPLPPPPASTAATQTLTGGGGSGQVVRYGHPRGGSVLGVRRQDSDTNPRSLSRSGNNQYYYA